MAPLRILHFEDDPADALLVRRTLDRHGFSPQVTLVHTSQDYRAALDRGGLDLILVDDGLPGFSGTAALQLARERRPEVPFIFVSGAAEEAQALASLDAGATDFVLKNQLWQLVVAIRRIAARARPSRPPADPAHRDKSATDPLMDAGRAREQDRTLDLQTANRELEAFTYSISHDLRSPLSSISALANMLNDSEIANSENDRRQYTQLIQSEVKKMTTLMDDLLRLSNLARLELQRENVNLSSLASEIVKTLQSQSPARTGEFKIQEKLEVQGDSGLLRVALENLLSNAWKYSAGRERATIEFGADTQTNGSLVYFVRDNGVGLDMQQADNAFIPFQRLYPEDDCKGQGIGLATVQRIIQRHGGRIWVQSEPNKGATFFFTLA